MSLSVRDLVALLLEVRHAGVELISNPGPAELDDENQDWQGDGADDQNRLQTDGAALVAVNPRQEPAKRGEIRHDETPSRNPSNSFLKPDPEIGRGKQLREASR